MKILDRTKLFLKATKMPQTELAERLGIANTALNRLLKGHAGKSSIALKLDAFLDEQNFYPQKHSTPIHQQEERQNA